MPVLRPGEQSEEVVGALPEPTFDGAAARFVHLLGWAALTAIVLVLACNVGIPLAVHGVDAMLQGRSTLETVAFPTSPGHHVWRPGIELTIIPIAVLVAAWSRLGWKRIAALRTSRLGAWLPLLMAACLVGMGLFLEWSWDLRSDTRPPDVGWQRWLGTALAGAFTVFWLPLFPRLTAALGGMIAGPAIFAILGYAFFESFMTEPQIAETYQPPGERLATFIPLVSAAMLLGLAMLSNRRRSVLWLAVGFGRCGLSQAEEVLTLLAFLFPLGLWLLVLLDKVRLRAHPITCAGVSSLLVAGLAAFGAAIGSALYQFPF